VSLIDEYEKRLNKLYTQKKILAVKVLAQLKLVEQFVKMMEKGYNVSAALSNEVDKLRDLLYGGYIDVIEEIHGLQREVEELKKYSAEGD